MTTSFYITLLSQRTFMHELRTSIAVAAATTTIFVGFSEAAGRAVNLCSISTFMLVVVEKTTSFSGEKRLRRPPPPPQHCL